MSDCKTCRGTGEVPMAVTTHVVLCPDCARGEQRAIAAGIAKTWRFHRPGGAGRR
jgi:hypothetical protein